MYALWLVPPWRPLARFSVTDLEEAVEVFLQGLGKSQRRQLGSLTALELPLHGPMYRDYCTRRIRLDRQNDTLLKRIGCDTVEQAARKIYLRAWYKARNAMGVSAVKRTGSRS